MSQTSNLYRLQQIDTQIDLARQRLRQIEVALSEDVEVEQARQRLEQAEKSDQESRRLLRRAEELVKAQRIKIEQTEASLYGGKIRNPKELQDLQNEAVALKRYLSVLEDQQLDAMATAEESEARLKEVADEFEVIRGRAAEKQAGLKGEQGALLAQVERLETERRAALSSLSEEHIRLYEQLRQMRKGLAVTRVLNRACEACGATLSPAVIQAAQSAAILTRCPSCGRILYVG